MFGGLRQLGIAAHLRIMGLEKLTRTPTRLPETQKPLNPKTLHPSPYKITHYKSY